MSFVKLKDLRDRFESKWLNGAFKFGYLSDINADHNIDYPLLLVTPPSNVIPNDTDDLSLYEFECHILKPFYQNQSTSLDVVFDLLEQEGLLWLQKVLDSYTLNEVILEDEIEVVRQKERFNDKLLHITMNFTLNTFRKAFGEYDLNRIESLSPLVWLRSDIGVKTEFSGGTEVVKKWIDQSGNANHFEQSTVAKMPSYVYESSDNGYPELDFDGSNDFMSCVNTGINAGTGIAGEHTIVWVAKADATDSQTFFLSKSNDGLPIQRFSVMVNVDSSNNIWQVEHFDGVSSGNDSTRVFDSSTLATTTTVRAVNFHNKTAKLFKNGTQVATSTSSQFDIPSNYGVGRKIHLGSDDDGTDKFFNGSVQEVMIFNTKLSEAEIVTVSNYLQHKYNIA
jgi:hypothetical protein